MAIAEAYNVVRGVMSRADARTEKNSYFTLHWENSTLRIICCCHLSRVRCCHLSALAVSGFLSSRSFDKIELIISSATYLITPFVFNYVKRVWLGCILYPIILRYEKFVRDIYEGSHFLV